MAKPEKHEYREAWLASATRKLGKTFFADNGLELPGKLQCSCGFPKARGGKAIGQCWNPATSADGTTQMFISPTLGNDVVSPQGVLPTLLHELIHACVGTEAGHKGPFKKLMKQFGLQGKATATLVEPGTELHTKLNLIAGELGPYPHAAMTPMKKEGRRGAMGGWVRLKSVTDERYKVLVSPKMIDECGMPRDPWGEEMEPV